MKSIPKIINILSVKAFLLIFGLNLIPSANAHLYTSSKEQISIAKYLTSIDATLYGIDSCLFTDFQKQIFGRKGTEFLNYKDCAIENCTHIEAYPTWIINNQQYKGTHSLEKLKELSKYSESN